MYGRETYIAFNHNLSMIELRPIISEENFLPFKTLQNLRGPKQKKQYQTNH